MGIDMIGHDIKTLMIEFFGPTELLPVIGTPGSVMVGGGQIVVGICITRISSHGLLEFL